MDKHAKRPSATKSGPGRYHAAGTKKISPKPAKGAPFGFEQREASAAKKLRRQEIATMGRRQYLRAVARCRTSSSSRAWTTRRGA